MVAVYLGEAMISFVFACNETADCYMTDFQSWTMLCDRGEGVLVDNDASKDAWSRGAKQVNTCLC